ncbi:MAG: signal peptide peptidase SppA [Treponema sp.]|nr:signal peptide peptidase SppA [Treponema sp.]
MKRTNTSGLIVFIIIVIIAVAGAVLSLFSPRSDYAPALPRAFGISFGSTTGRKPFFPQSDYIARLYITGTITEATRTYNQEWLLDTIAALKDDPHNTGIMLNLDTPGGSVYQSDEAYLALLDYKESTGRPVYAYITQMSASGGYYISCAADKIFGNRNGLTGSIGVIFGSSIDATELLKNIGIKTKTFHAGRNKTMLSFDEPLTEEQEAIMQAIADEAYEQFVGIVAESRNMTVEDVRTLADGSIYTTTMAARHGLIDGVCTFDEALERMKADESLEDSDVEEFSYEYKETFSSLFGNILSRTLGTDALAKHLERAAISYPAYYFSW